MAQGDSSARLRLARLAIRDFRGIDSIELDLADATGEPVDLAVFGGANGSGKTAVLEAVLLLLNLPEFLPDDAPPPHEQVRFGAAQSDIRAGFRWAARRGVPPEDFEATLALGPEAVRRARQILWGGREVLTGLNWTTHSLVLPSIEYFSARREPDTREDPFEARSGRTLLEARRLVEFRQKLISTYYRSLRSRGKSLEGDSPFARLQRFWERFSPPGEFLDVIPKSNDPGSGDEVVLRDSRTVPEDVTSLAMARELAPTRADIPRLVPLSRLSSGQVALFAFAAPLVFRDTPAHVVLIDEPEQHLHVQWQRLLLPALRELSPTSQFLVATHSEEILEAAMSYERFLLVDDADPRARDSASSGAQTIEGDER